MSEQSDLPLVGGIEAGGTKFVCAVGRDPTDVAQPVNRIEFSSQTGSPDQVLAQVIGWFRQQEKRLGQPLAAIGIGCFGPIDRHPDSPTYGHITTTPKLGWGNFDMVGAIRQGWPHIPIEFDTDVNAAAFGEYRWGTGQGCEDFVYITIGTGIGGGAVVGGRLLHGLVHPEMGHMLLRRIPDDPFPGLCSRHGACWEGLCSGPAIHARAGRSAIELDPADPAWIYTTRYTAYALANLTCILSPQRIILGGSVRKGGQLGETRFMQRVREEVQTALAGYIVSPLLQAGIQDYIVVPQLGDDAGVCGALALALERLQNAEVAECDL
ncbi:MAG: ROK family protein [Elainella sp. Prado103]|jgi:fructokinase|nr:ROK family protein [Elainella sp. Prado103]